jgi:hypothetical protein
VPDLTVMTWNLQNLFPVGHADGPATQQEYDDKIAGLAEVINAVEPDVLALQEIGPKQVLADLNAACSTHNDRPLAGRYSTALQRDSRVADVVVRRGPSTNP